MIDITLSDKTKQKLRELGVSVVYYFGSGTENTHLPFSDIDIGIVVKDPDKNLSNPSRFFLDLYEILDKDVPDRIKGKKLDLSLLQKANPVLAMKAIKSGHVLMETDPVFRADFEEYITHKYNDYLPLKREYEEASIRAFS